MFSRKVKKAKDPQSLDAAIKTSENILAYADNTEKQLRQKLQARDFDREIIEEAIEKMKKQGFLCDKRYMENLALSLAKRMGLSAIKQKLYQKGFSKSEIDNNLEEILSSVDFFEIALNEYAKIYRGDDKKACASLYRHGFSGEEIAYARKEFLKKQQNEE